MSDTKFSKLFRSYLTEAPVNVSDPGLSSKDIGIPTNNDALKQDLGQTADQLGMVSQEKQEALSKLDGWITTAESLAKEIGDTSPDSWVNTIKKVSSNENKDGIINQLSKAAKTLDDIKNTLRTIVNTESGKSTPPSESI